MTMPEDPLSQAHQYANRGVQAASDGDLHRALDHYAKAMTLFESLGLADDIARVTGNRAAARTGLGRAIEALEDYRQVLAHHRDNGDGSRIAATLTNLGQLELGVGDLRSAVPHLEEAIAGHTASGSKVHAALTTAILANAIRASGEAERAVGLLIEAEQALTELDQPVLAAVARGARAMADLEDGRPQDAIDGFEGVLPILESRFEQPHAHYLLGYGEALDRIGDHSGGAIVTTAERLIRQRDWQVEKALVHTTRARMLARAGSRTQARDEWLRAKAMATVLKAGPGSPLGQDLMRTEALIASVR